MSFKEKSRGLIYDILILLVLRGTEELRPQQIWIRFKPGISLIWSRCISLMKIAAVDYTVLQMTRGTYKEGKTRMKKHTRMCLLVLGIKVKENSFFLPGKWACWPLVNVFRLGQGLLRSEWSPYHSAPSEHSFLFFLVLPSDIYLQPQFTVVKKKTKKGEEE